MCRVKIGGEVWKVGEEREGGFNGNLIGGWEVENIIIFVWKICGNLYLFL